MIRDCAQVNDRTLESERVLNLELDTQTRSSV